MASSRSIRCTLALFLWAAFSLVGCQGDSADGPTGSGDPERDRPISVRQRDQALAAQKELFERLSERLMAARSEDGPAEAIAVCSQEALAITRQVGETHGVTIGRTSFRLRNGENVPPSWAANLIQQRVEEPQFVNLPNDQLGALLPIRLKPQCLLCHGATEQIPDEVKKALAERYPDDQATGFEIDALRGWFWVEVPPETL